jgi:hypothetical protein
VGIGFVVEGQLNAASSASATEVDIGFFLQRRRPSRLLASFSVDKIGEQAQPQLACRRHQITIRQFKYNQLDASTAKPRKPVWSSQVLRARIEVSSVSFEFSALLANELTVRLASTAIVMTGACTDRRPRWLTRRHARHPRAEQLLEV